MRKGPVWMGFAFKEFFPYTYYPSRKSGLSKSFQNMKLGHTQTMLWGTEKERWEATLIIIGTEAEVQTLIDDLINGTVLYSSLNLDEPQVNPNAPAKRGRKPKNSAPSIGAWNKQAIKVEKEDDEFPKTPAKRGRKPKAATALIGPWDKKVIKVEKKDAEAPKRPRLDDEAAPPAEEVIEREEEAREEENGENNEVVEQGGAAVRADDQVIVIGQILGRPAGVEMPDVSEDEGDNEEEEDVAVVTIDDANDEEEQTEVMRRYRAAQSRMGHADTDLQVKEKILNPYYEAFKAAKREQRDAREELELARRAKNAERRERGYVGEDVDSD